MNWHYPGGLPVVARRDDILDALRHHDVVVVVSETGSGKTTQLPKMVAEVLREIYAEKMGLVGVTQPRFARITARWYVRGGIYTNVIAEHRKKGWKPQPAVALPELPRETGLA